MKKSKSRTLVLPDQSPPEPWRLKYLALLYDRILVPHPNDRAVLNADDYEVNPPAQFGVTRIVPAAQMKFLRDDDYDDRYDRLLTELQPLIHRGVVEVLPLRPDSRDEAKKILDFAGSVISNPDLVRAAVPDRTYLAPKFSRIAQAENEYSFCPVDVQLEWIGLRKALPRIRLFGRPYKIPGIDDGWSYVAWLRLGCMAKYLRKASLLEATPMSLDPLASRLLSTIASGGAVPADENVQASMVLSWTILNPNNLEVHLRDMTWHDALRVRSELLPVFGRISSEMERRVRRLPPISDVGLESYREAIASLQGEFEKLQAAELEARGNVVTKLLVGMGAGAAAAAAHAWLPAQSWASVGTFLGATVGTGLTLKDVSAWFVASRAKKRHLLHPIFAFERQLADAKAGE